MALSREEIEKISKASADEILEQLSKAKFYFREPPSVQQGLRDSMGEELTAAQWYRERAKHARKQNDDKTATLYDHIADEESHHYWEFNSRLASIS